MANVPSGPVLDHPWSSKSASTDDVAVTQTFSSGVPGADWNLCSAMIPKPEGGFLPCFTLVPKKDYVIDWASWKVVGMAGTGSYDVIVEDAFGGNTQFVWFDNFVTLFEDPGYYASAMLTLGFSAAVAATWIGVKAP